eukprot:9591765-Heterocapsa_arctica.AAC.1
MVKRWGRFCIAKPLSVHIEKRPSPPRAIDQPAAKVNDQFTPFSDPFTLLSDLTLFSDPFTPFSKFIYVVKQCMEM